MRRRHCETNQLQRSTASVPESTGPTLKGEEGEEEEVTIPNATAGTTKTYGTSRRVSVRLMRGQLVPNLLTSPDSILVTRAFL